MTIKIKARGKNEAEIRIDGEIGENWFGDGLTSNKFAEDLQKLGAVQKITVKVNSPGGAVHDGISIYNQLRNHGARIEVLVEGLAASIASIIAMSGDVIRMGTGSMMMIHSPWTIALGNADDMRKVADVLEKHEDALLDIYVKRSGAKRDDVQEMLAAETWMTGAEAMKHGFCDECDAEHETEDTEKAAHRDAFEKFANEFRQNTAALTPLQIAAALKSAVADATQETIVKTPAASVPGADNPQNTAKDKTNDPAAAQQQAATADQISAARREGAAAETTRCNEIRSRFPGPLATEYAAMLQESLADPAVTPDIAAKKLLDTIGAKHQPIGPGASGPLAEPGADESEKRMFAATQAILARVGVSVSSADKDSKFERFPVIDASNPFRGFTLYDLAEDSVKRAGVNVRGMNRSAIVAAAFVRPISAAAFGHTTSDFPNLLENVMHKLLLVAYHGAQTTWQRIARIGDLTDFRAHPRYRFGTFSDIKTVNQAGNYEQGTISDAEKDSITAVRKGRILVVSRELVVNDDLQALSDAARSLGRAANRTIDKDLYALLALNSGNGPTLGDGVAMFNGTTTGHKNIAVTAAVPTMTSLDAARVQMAKQLDPSGNDYVDIRPSIAWCPLALGSTFRTLNEAQYDPVDNKFQKPNVVRGLFRDVVDSPRLDALSAQVWYVLADPNEEPVFEVGFIGGVREPRVEQEQQFSSDSLQWKVVHEYGVAGIGYRGILKNAGA